MQQSQCWRSEGRKIKANETVLLIFKHCAAQLSPSISKVFLSRLKSSTKALEASLEFRPLRIRRMDLSEHFQCRWRYRSHRSTITQSLRSATFICWWSDRPTIFRHSLGSQVSSKQTVLFENPPKVSFQQDNFGDFHTLYAAHLLGCTMELIFYRNAEAISAWPQRMQSSAEFKQKD